MYVSFKFINCILNSCVRSQVRRLDPVRERDKIFTNGTKCSRMGRNVRERAAFADGTEHIPWLKMCYTLQMEKSYSLVCGNVL